jgi:hypothetical protein
VTKKLMNNMDAVAIFPIRYRKEDPGTAESRLEEFDARREQIEEIYNHMPPEMQLDLILMFINTAEMRLRLTPPGTHVARWLDIMSRALRQFLMVMTHLQPGAPKPSIALEDPSLYWPNDDGVTLN